MTIVAVKKKEKIWGLLLRIKEKRDFELRPKIDTYAKQQPHTSVLLLLQCVALF